MQQGDFLAMLANEIGKIGTAKKAAEKWGVSPQYLSDLLKGRREPGPKILDEFGLYRRVSYEPKDTSGVGIAQETDFVGLPISADGKQKHLAIGKEQP